MFSITDLTRSLREPGGPCTKSMKLSESRMERVKSHKYASISDTGISNQELKMIASRTDILVKSKIVDNIPAGKWLAPRMLVI